MKIDDLTLPQQQYVETIADQVARGGSASISGLAGKMGVSLPSASQAVRRLADLGVTARRSWREIVLTKQGAAISKQLQHRQNVFLRFMVKTLLMDREAAERNACRIEHCVDPFLADRIRRFVEFLQSEMPAEMRSKWHQAIRRDSTSRKRNSGGDDSLESI